MVFLVCVFFIKNNTSFKNTTQQQAGVVYGNQTIPDLVNKDSNGDGIPDWQEVLMGKDPNKKNIENDAGITKGKSDSEQSISSDTAPENLTKTDKFSRELFSTVAALNQAGSVDQNTVDKLSSSLADQIKNTPVRKVYLLSDLKLSKSDNKENVTTYNKALGVLLLRYKAANNVTAVLKEFVDSGNEPDVKILSKLDPIIEKMNGLKDGMIELEVPPSISSTQLNVINGLERVVENLDDIKLFDTDPVISMGGVSKYEENASSLEKAAQDLTNFLKQRLTN